MTTKYLEAVESMVTAVLARDPAAQQAVAEQVGPEAEPYVRAGASIIAGNYRSIAAVAKSHPLTVWRKVLGEVTALRTTRAAMARRDPPDSSAGPSQGPIGGG